MITAAQRREIARLLFGLYPALTPGMVYAWVSTVTPVPAMPAGPGTPRSACVRFLTRSQAETLIAALRAAQDRQRPSQGRAARRRVRWMSLNWAGNIALLGLVMITGAGGLR